jgi:hypothetical protein
MIVWKVRFLFCSWKYLYWDHAYGWCGGQRGGLHKENTGIDIIKVSLEGGFGTTSIIISQSMTCLVG